MASSARTRSSASRGRQTRQRPGRQRPAHQRPASRTRPRGQQSQNDERRGFLAALWDRLRAMLRRLQRKLKQALAGPQARQVLTALLARRLPGPLRVLVEGIGDPDQRGFLFWWLVVTLGMTLLIAMLLSVALAPVTGLLALIGVGVWMLVHHDREPAAET